MWRGILLLFAFVLLGAGKPHPQQGQQAQTQQQVQGAPTTSQYAAYPDWRADACYKSSNHDAADLCAQWRAAIAAEQAAHQADCSTDWAIVATFLSACAFGVLVWSLVQTERSLGEARTGNKLSMKQNARNTLRAIAGREETAAALEAAHQSARAAVDQVAVAQEAAYRQLRAYISIETPKVVSVDADTISGELTIRNAGQTPAAIALHLAARIEKFPILNLPEGAPEPSNFPFHGPYINAHGSEVVSWFYQLASQKPSQDAPAEIARVIAEPLEFALYLYGRIEFMDYKRHRRVLKFAYRNEGAVTLGKSGDRMIPCPWGNEYEDLDRDDA